MTTYKPIDLNSTGDSVRDLLAGHHVPGTPYRYKHGWIKLDGAGALAANFEPGAHPKIKETRKYGSLGLSYTQAIQAHADGAFASALKKAIGRYANYGDMPEGTYSLKPGSPEHAWAMYQSQFYVPINAYFRHGVNASIPDSTAKAEAEGMLKAFDTMGMQAPKHIKLYRGLQLGPEVDGRTWRSVGFTRTKV